MEALSIFAALAAGMARGGADASPTVGAEGFDRAMTSALEAGAVTPRGQRTGDAPSGEPEGEESTSETADDTVILFPGASPLDALTVAATPGGWSLSFGGAAEEGASALEAEAPGGEISTAMATMAGGEAVNALSPVSPSPLLEVDPAPEAGAGAPEGTGQAAPAADAGLQRAGDGAGQVLVEGAGGGSEAGGILSGVAAQASRSAPVDEVSSLSAAAGLVEGAGGGDGVGGVDRADDVRPAGGPDTDRDLRKLDPELLTRLQRVVDRMEAEHGHSVELVEGYRSQERQNMLFAQGRGAPGPVVTWTRESAHTSGRAVDVRIDGGWADGRAFARLQQIAQEEGLVTLGMRDPGHLELPDTEGGAGAQAPDFIRPLGTRSAEGGLNLTGQRFAPVASPATPTETPQPRIAPVAPVAPVAPTPRRMGGGEVLVDGAPLADGAIAGDQAGTSGIAGAAAAEGDTAPRGQVADARAQLTPTGTGERFGAAGGRAGDPGSESGRDRENRDDRRPAIATESAGVRTSGADADFGAATGVDALRSGQSVSGASEVQGANPLSRLEQVMAIQDRNAASGPGMRVTMHDADGEGTRVQVGLRGTEVGARVDAAADQVASLRARVGELRAALEGRGLDATTIRLQADSEARDTMAALRTGDTGLDALRTMAGDLAGDGGQREERDSSGSQDRDGRNPGSEARSQRDGSGDEPGRRREFAEIADEFLGAEAVSLRAAEPHIEEQQG